MPWRSAPQRGPRDAGRRRGGAALAGALAALGLLGLLGAGAGLGGGGRRGQGAAFHRLLVAGGGAAGLAGAEAARPGPREEAFIGYSEAGAARRVVLEVEGFGPIAVQLRADWAPRTARMVAQVARAKACPPTSCNFYRSEAVPEPGAVDNFGGPGPPYALLQGKLPLSGKLPKEGTPVVKRGMVCLIGEGPDFFIAVGDHAEWGHAHTVWGEVHDMAVVDAIVAQAPVVKQTWGQTHVTALQTPIKFGLREGGPGDAAATAEPTPRFGNV